MRRRLILALALFAVPALAQAQTHPCDLATATSGTAIAGATVTLSACHSGLDANGNNETITGWALYDNAVRTTPVLTAGTAVSTTGLKLYSVTMTAPATAGVHSYQIAALDASGEGAKSTPPFVLTVSLPPTVPAAPSKLTVK